MSKVFSVVHGTYTAKELVGALSARFPDDFEILMVHSSYDHLLPMCSSSPLDVVKELIAYCGRKRTLVMPAFFLGGRLRDKKGYYSRHVFDVRRTVSEMGLLTEVFRRMPEVKRSLHPTHSICALGPLADELTAKHHLAPTRTGKGTPFEFITRRRSLIAGLGVEYFRVLAQTHTAEDMLGDRFPVEFTRETFPVTLVDGEGTKVPYELTVLGTSRTLDNTILRSLLAEDELREWKFRGTPLFFTFADKVTDALLKAAQKGITVYGSHNPP
jgi:aminoglycoside N3'-acetyltransferase